MIAGFSDKSERALREALTSVARMETDRVPPSLAALDDRGRTEAIGLAVLITCYVMVDACGNQWPNEASVRQIAADLATTGTRAKQMHLDAGKIYEYLWRTVMGTEQLEDVIPDEPEFTLLPVIAATQALGVYCPKDIGFWDYLDRIESGIEIASALDTWVIPAAVMRGYMEKPGARGKTPSA